MNKYFLVGILIATLWIRSDRSFAQLNEDHQHETQGSSLQLNHGQKWQTDQHTYHSIQLMESSVEKFQEASSPSPEVYQKLGDELGKQLKTLIAGCTMEGAAHTQLHRFIERLDYPIKELSKAEKANMQAFEQISKELKIFHDFFEYLPKN